METPAAIGMIEIPGRGRSMVALRPLKAGEVILKDSPILLYSALPFHPTTTTNPQTIYCSNCFIKTSNHPHTISCPSCRSHFCTPNCQAIASATSHTPWVCQMLSHLHRYFSENRLPLDTQLQARYLVSAYNLAVVSPTKFHTLLSLQGSGGESEQTVSFLHSLIGSVCKPMPVEIGFCLGLTCALLAKDKVNAFGFMEPFDEEREERSVRAYGIYPMASFFNHDCLPNACRFDYIDVADGGVGKNSEISIRMIHDVVEGREICLSYFPVNLKYSERQKRLEDDYGFVCECDRCKVEANWSDSEDDGVDMDDGDDGKDDEGEGEETTMDEDVEMEGEDGGGMNGDDGGFPHSYFFLNYMCDRKNCWGTLAPLQPSSVATNHCVMECNVCGNCRKVDQV